MHALMPKRVVIELLKKVVDLGIDLDARDNNGWTALDRAREEGHFNGLQYWRLKLLLNETMAALKIGLCLLMILMALPS